MTGTADHVALSKRLKMVSSRPLRFLHMVYRVIDEETV